MSTSDRIRKAALFNKSVKAVPFVAMLAMCRLFGTEVLLDAINYRLADTMMLTSQSAACSFYS